MCGHYTRYLPWSELHRLYCLTEPAETPQPRYNIAPTQYVLFVTKVETG